MIAHESGAADSVDPFAGSYMIEALTDDIERRAAGLIERVDALGGSLEAIPFIINEIDESAWSYQERYRTGQDLLVGVNTNVEEGEARDRGDPPGRPGERARPGGAARGVPDGARRDARRARLHELREAARGSTNLLEPIGAAMRDRCTLGEVCGAMGEVFGSYQPH